MMKRIDRLVAREAKAMTRQEVIVKAAEGRITWLQAADILGLSPGWLVHRCRDAPHDRTWSVALP